MIQFETAIFNAKKEYFDNIVDELTNVLLLDKRTANYKPRQIKIIFTEQSVDWCCSVFRQYITTFKTIVCR